MNSHPDPSTQLLAHPNDSWRKKWDSCNHKDEQAVQIYNALVREWNAWAKEDAAEKEANWIYLIDRLSVIRASRAHRFARIVTLKARSLGGGRATVCWGYCILASFFHKDLTTETDRQLNRTLSQLQKWYPRSKIMEKHHYNEDGPSFTCTLPGAFDLVPVRGTVLQGNPQVSSSHENNTPQQSNHPQESDLS